MRSESHPRGRHNRRDENHHEGQRRGRPEKVDGKEKRHGAKTFRRGRALAFYDMMNMKSIALKKQLETPELQSINPIIVGELKAVEMLMEEFSQLFELYEVEETTQEIINEDKPIDTES
ncbi:hypothetical protein [Psychrobacillus antarcticus]|uniref:hypothetical protein n=1 Tax=Psychrobacillus antarcticus TaxID=2879115 RepID=UPI002407A37E|nr:hypothetical protein [Psychrobacillus antarcticus]